MPQKCSICLHPKRQYIDRMLISGKQSIRTIAARYEVSTGALNRHKKHLVHAIVEAKQNGDIKHAKTAFEQFVELVEEAERKYRTSKGSEQVAWFRERRALLEQAFKLGIEAQRAKEREQFRDVTPAVEELIESMLEEEGGGADA